jgi:hypothetical protein
MGGFQTLDQCDSKRNMPCHADKLRKTNGFPRCCGKGGTMQILAGGETMIYPAARCLACTTWA